MLSVLNACSEIQPISWSSGRRDGGERTRVLLFIAPSLFHAPWISLLPWKFPESLKKHTYTHTRTVSICEKCIIYSMWIEIMRLCTCFSVCSCVSLSYDWCLSSNIRRLKTNEVEAGGKRWRRKKNSHLRGPKQFNHLTSKPCQWHAQTASSVLCLLHTASVKFKVTLLPRP